jgi:hypothetical protein
MACKCKVTENINYIQSKYGSDLTDRKKTDIRGMVSKYVLNMILWILTLPAIPIMFAINIFKSLTNSKIKFSKLVRPLEHVRN